MNILRWIGWWERVKCVFVCMGWGVTYQTEKNQSDENNESLLRLKWLVVFFIFLIVSFAEFVAFFRVWLDARSACYWACAAAGDGGGCAAGASTSAAAASATAATFGSAWHAQ